MAAERPSSSSFSSAEGLLRTADEPGGGFKAKVRGRWRGYAPACDQLLRETCSAGCPSMRLSVKGNMYKFDFDKMTQYNLNTLEECEMLPPEGLRRPPRRSVFSVENLKNPFSVGARKSLKDAVHWKRPVMVVRVPAGGPGTVIRVPHPKKLGKAMRVSVPAEAKVGEPLFVQVPRTATTRAKYAVGGVAAGAAGTCTAAVLVTEASGSAAAGGAATAGGVAGIAAAGAPVLAGAAVLAGSVMAAGAAVHYAANSPAKAVAIGALTIGGLAFADHVAEVGIVEATGDVAAGAGSLVDAVVGGAAGDAASAEAAAAAAGGSTEAAVAIAAEPAAAAGEGLLETGAAAAEHADCAGEELLEGVDWLGEEAGDALDFCVDILSELF